MDEFRCWACRRRRCYGHYRVTLTGRTRPGLGERSTAITSREYICGCGHVGWSTHDDLGPKGSLTEPCGSGRKRD